jgi:hypothetical protein
MSSHGLRQMSRTSGSNRLPPVREGIIVHGPEWDLDRARMAMGRSHGMRLNIAMAGTGTCSAYGPWTEYGGSERARNHQEGPRALNWERPKLGLCQIDALAGTNDSESDITGEINP